MLANVGSQMRFESVSDSDTSLSVRELQMQKLLIAAGLLLVLVGLAWPWLRKLPFGRLPGDISIERENFAFHFPLTTMIIVSVVITLLLWFLRR